MLVAKLDQTLFMLKPTISREELILLRKKKRFTCPQCEEPLILKIGQMKIPHFAHLPNSSCDNLFAEGESQIHLLGKRVLYEFFESHSLQVLLEPYLQKLAQRPDLLVMQNDLQYAIEFQCSPIDSTLFLKRTNSYSQNGIVPIWILNTPMDKVNELKKVYRITLSQFEQQFIHKHTFLPFLLTFNPSSSTFYYFAHIMHLQFNQFLTRVSQIPIQNQRFPFYVPKMISFEDYVELYFLYKVEQKRYIQTRLKTSRLGVNDILLRSFYELRLNFEEYPEFIGVPIKGSSAFKMNTVEWQSAYFYYCNKFGLPVVEQNLEKHVRFLRWIKQDDNDEKIYALNEYCALLRDLSIENVRSTYESKRILRNVYSQQLQYG